MTMQGQGESQPGESVSLDSLAAQLGGEEGAEESGGDESEESEELDLAGEESSDEEAEGEEEQEAQSTVRIKHDGKDVELPLSEAIELAQKGFDFTKKTMAVAEERKAVEATKAQAEQFRQQYQATLEESSGRLKAIVEFMQGSLGEPPPIEWASTDAGYYIAQKEQYESRKGQLDKALHAAHAIQMEQQRTRQASIHQQIAETQGVLKDTLPDWNHAKEEELAKYVGQQGLTPDISDMAFWKPAFWQMAHKAKAYDELLAKKATLKPVSELPKVHKPTANNQPPQLAKRQEAMKAHRAKPSLKTLADLL